MHLIRQVQPNRRMKYKEQTRFKQTIPMNYKIKKHSDLLYQILLTPPIDGFEDFICVWVFRGKETFIVDPGPSVTAGDLLAALREIGFKSLDYILLTHIHLDHAGGIGEVSAAFPETPVICHDIARPHLIDPGKLWQGTLKTLGDTGRAYGEIKAVPEKRLLNIERFSAKTVKPVPTPGHAPHHVSYITSDGILFAGEAGGVNIDFHNTAPYLRPATPPKFFMETSLASIDRLLSEAPERICYGHTAVKNDAVDWLKKHKEQLLSWKDLIAGKLRNAKNDNPARLCADQLIESDPLMRGLSYATAPVFRREYFFILNSVKGFIGYLDDSA